MDWLSVLTAIAPKGKPSIIAATALAMPGIAAEFNLANNLRLAHFIAQIAHESAGFKTTVEYASGAAYEGRADLGNNQVGDGKRFKGRGLIQLTGRANYIAATKALGADFIGRPEIAAQFPHAIRVAGWYWATHKLNALADADNAVAITRKINGGTNGIDDRMRYLARAKKALAAPNDVPAVPPKTMTTSKTGGAAILAGVGGAVPAIKEAADAAKDVTDTASALTSLGPWVLLVLVIIGAVGFIWWSRRQKMQEHGI